MTEEHSSVSITSGETDTATAPSPEEVSAPQESPTPADVPSPEETPVSQEPSEPVDGPSMRLEDLQPGMRLQGKIVNVVKFGAFVDVGVGQDGLVHISELEKEGLQNQVKRGQKLDVWVQNVKLESRRLSLALRRRTALRDLPVGSRVDGRIVRIEKFGAFVDIGAVTDGLVHVSKFPLEHASGPADAPKVGDEARVWIESVDVKKRRISLSMREQASRQGSTREPKQAPRPVRRGAPRQRRRKPSTTKPFAYEDQTPSLPTAMQVALEEAFEQVGEKITSRKRG